MSKEAHAPKKSQRAMSRRYCPKKQSHVCIRSAWNEKAKAHEQDAKDCTETEAKSASRKQ